LLKNDILELGDIYVFLAHFEDLDYVIWLLAQISHALI